MPEQYSRAREGLRTLAEQLGGLEDLPAGTREALREIRREAHRLFQENKWDDALAALERHSREVERLRGARPSAARH
jgi:hypothetical protein